MATNPQGIMALPENDQMTSPQAEMPQMTLDDSYDVVTQGLENASPEAALANKQALAQIAPQLEALPPDQLDALMRVFQYLYDHPEEYQEKVADLVANGKFEQGDFPDEYDPEFLSVVLLAIVDVRRRAQSQAPEQAMAPPPGMARGGIAEAARMAMSKGRGNDTMLAHITPKEAKMLRSKGGAGIINPDTGLPEYDLWSSIRDTITAPARAVIDVAKQVVASPIGKIAATVGLAMLIGPAAFGLSGALGTAASMAVASGAVTAIGGGNISDILKSAAIGGATAFFGAPGGVVSNFVGGAVTNAAANAAISAGIVGTGVGLATGQSLQESIQSGLTAGAVSGLVTGADKGFTTDMTAAKTGVVGEPTPSQNQPPQALSPEQVQANIARQAQQTAQQTALDQSGVNQPLTGPQASMPQGAPSGAAAGQAGAAGGPAPGYQVPGLGEGVSNMGKGIMQMMPGTEGSFSGEGGGYDQFMKGAGQVFAPSPSAQQVADYASANNMSVTEASKLMSPGLMRTYGPGIAAGLAATKVMGGFDTAPATPSAARSDIEDRLARERAEVVANPGKYVPQGIPGLIYNNRGEITGSEPFSSKATMDDIRVPTPEYVPRPTNVVGSNYQLPQNTFTSRTGGQSIYQPYNTSSMYSNIMPPVAYADGGYATQPPIHAFGGGLTEMLRKVDFAMQPAQQQFKSGFNAVGDMIRPEAPPTPSSSAPVSVSQTFASNPFSTKLLPGEFAENANRIDANRASRVASAQQAYEEQARAQAAAAQQAATAGTARGRRMFFDPRIGIAKSMQRAEGGIANLSESKYYPRKTGHISGPGTETSDSIPAMLSDGEFVMTAKAVKALGKGNRRAGAKKMYALMHQLERNASRG
jgi:hypothetical protein